MKSLNEAVDRVFVGLLGLPCLVLKDKFNFTSEQLTAFVDELLECYDSYEKDYITLKDVETVLYEEAGVTVRRE